MISQPSPVPASITVYLMNTYSRRDFLRASTTAGLAAGAWAALKTTHAQTGAGAKPPKIRIGQIGTAHAHAAGKMDTLRHSDDFELVGVVEPDPQRRAAAEKNQTSAGLPWVNEGHLLNTPDLQAVAVETDVKDLVPTAARCIAAGKHVHLDKPAGESLAAFKRLLDDAARR